MNPALRIADGPGDLGDAIKGILDWVMDPEIPVISVVELGIFRRVEQGPDGSATVVITPTYTACPATHYIEESVRAALDENGFEAVAIRHEIAPPWTTDWISEAGRQKLADYGIAPPAYKTAGAQSAITCPRCGTDNVEMVSAFGSTPCKSHYKCRGCLEPFDQFKCI